MTKESVEKPKVKLGKVYNPYSFPVRVINDLGKEQWVMQNERIKIKLGKDNKYDQSPLTLPAYDMNKKKHQKKIKVLGDMVINKVLLPDLRKLMWALGLEVNKSLNKRSLINLITGKVTEWTLPSDKKSGLETLKR